MNDLHDIQREIVVLIDTRPVGSTSRFRLMDAADAVSKAMAAVEKEVGAELARCEAEHHPETQQSRAPDIGAELGEHRP